MLRSNSRAVTSGRFVEGAAPARQPGRVVDLFDRRLYLEPLLEVGSFPMSSRARLGNATCRGRSRLPQVHGAPAIRLLVGNPRFGAQAANLGERLDGLVAQIAAERLDR